MILRDQDRADVTIDDEVLVLRLLEVLATIGAGWRGRDRESRGATFCQTGKSSMQASRCGSRSWFRPVVETPMAADHWPGELKT